MQRSEKKQRLGRARRSALRGCGRLGPLVSLLAVARLLAGCGSDLGECTPERAASARTRVVNSASQIVYAGQALLNSGCAAGTCHTSAAVGAKRQGVPAGLDYELRPLSEDPDLDPASPADVFDTLRATQLRVYELRESIWDEISSGRMPPPGEVQPPGASVLSSVAGCVRGEELGGLDTARSKQLMGDWLACGSPIVEVSALEVPAEREGVVGNREPACSADDCPELAPTYENVFDKLLLPSCVPGCHSDGGIWSLTNFQDRDTAYATLLEQTEFCPAPNDALRFIVPGDAENSYLYRKVINDPRICNFPMPYTEAVSDWRPLSCGIRLLEAWISAGAPGPVSGP